MQIDEIIEKINNSIYKDANKKMVVYGKVVRDVFAEQDMIIKDLSNTIKIKVNVERICDDMFEVKDKELKELREELIKSTNLSLKFDKENTKLKERVKMVLDSCNKNESMSDFAIATDSVRAMLTDFPIQKQPNKEDKQ